MRDYYWKTFGELEALARSLQYLNAIISEKGPQDPDYDRAKSAMAQFGQGLAEDPPSVLTNNISKAFPAADLRPRQLHELHRDYPLYLKWEIEILQAKSLPQIKAISSGFQDYCVQIFSQLENEIDKLAGIRDDPIIFGSCRSAMRHLTTPQGLCATHLRAVKFREALTRLRAKGRIN